MKSIEERARKYGEQKVGWSLSKSFDEQSALSVIAEKYETEYKSIAEEQQKVDIEKFASYAEKFNKDCEKLGMEERIDVDSMRKWASNVILCSLNSEE